MSKWIVSIGLCALLLWTSVSFAQSESGWKPVTPQRWGMTLSEYKRAVPGLTRTYAGLDSESRHYIARYCRDSRYRNADVRIYFSFKSNALYQIEYQFKRPGEELAAALREDFSKSFGHPISRRHGEPPAEPPFASRSIDSRIWLADDSVIELRESLSVIAGMPPLRNLFVTFRQRDSLPGGMAELTRAGRFGWQKQSAVTLAISGDVDALLLKSQALDMSVIAQAQRSADLRLVWLSGEPPAERDATPAARAFAELEAKVGHPGPAAQLAALGWRVIAVDSEQAAESWSSGVPSGAMLVPASDGKRHAQPRELAVNDQIFQIFAYKAASGLSGAQLGERIQKDLAARNSAAHVVVLLNIRNLMQSGNDNSDAMRAVRFGLEAGAALVVVFGNSPQPVLFNGERGAILGLGTFNVSRTDTGASAFPENISLIFWASFTKRGMIGYTLAPADVSGIQGDLIRPSVLDAGRYPRLWTWLYARRGQWGIDP